MPRGEGNKLVTLSARCGCVHCALCKKVERLVRNRMGGGAWRGCLSSNHPPSWTGSLPFLHVNGPDTEVQCIGRCTTDAGQAAGGLRRVSRSASIYLSANKHADASGGASTFDHRRRKSKVACCQTAEFQRGRSGRRAHSHSRKFVVWGGTGGER